jgi:hypothetical protein
MTHSQILEAIRLMPTIERLKILEFTLGLMREDINKDSEQHLNLAAAAEIMRDFYAEGSELSEFSDLSSEHDFYEYENYA